MAGAGNETTGRLIGWLAKVLAEHPRQRREIAEDRSLLTRAVDETLRFEPTGPHVARYLAADFDYAGTTVPAGSARSAVRGLAASIRRSTRRLKPMAALRAPTIATTIHPTVAQLGQPSPSD